MTPVRRHGEKTATTTTATTWTRIRTTTSPERRTVCAVRSAELVVVARSFPRRSRRGTGVRCVVVREKGGPAPVFATVATKLTMQPERSVRFPALSCRGAREATPHASDRTHYSKRTVTTLTARRACFWSCRGNEAAARVHRRARSCRESGSAGADELRDPGCCIVSRWRGHSARTMLSRNVRSTSSKPPRARSGHASASSRRA